MELSEPKTKKKGKPNAVTGKKQISSDYVYEEIERRGKRV